MGDIAVVCEGVGKKFSKSLKRSMMYGALDIMGNSIGLMPDSKVLRPGEFWAVEDVNFQLKRGTSFGIIGPNGSGKTTLLKMLNGIFMPDQGQIAIHGKVGALIQVGAGFHPMLSGRENIYINGAILGMTKKEIDARFDSIVDFADIGDFLESPVKFYSSGMYVRLGFAIAVHCRPDILLVDEVLAVGDLKFQTKCLKYITNNILKSGCCVIFVSHNRYAVEGMCDTSIYINKGKPVTIGKTREVLGKYLQDIKSDEKKELAEFDQEGISKIVFTDGAGNTKTAFKPGEEARIRIYYAFNQPVTRPSVGLSFYHNDPRYEVASSTDYLMSFHSGYDGIEIPTLSGRGYFEIAIDHLYMPVGTSTVHVYLYKDNLINLMRKYEDAATVEMLWSDNSPKRSLIELPHRWQRVEE